MLRLYRVLGDNRIAINALARIVGKDRKTVWRWLNDRARVSAFDRLRVESAMRAAGIRWKGDLWTSEADFIHTFFEHEALQRGPGVRAGVASLEGFSPTRRLTDAMTLGKEAVPMAQKIPQAVLEKFKLDRDPFVNELHGPEDVFMSKAHKRAEFELADAAAHQHFVALVGAVGAGKTVTLKRVLAKLERDPSFCVARLRCVEKEEATAFGIMEALVRAFSSDGPRSSREARALQIGMILDSMVKEKRRPVLVIDEAHALNYRTLRALKRLYDETEFGFRRSLAILLVGQNSNQDKSYNLEDKLGNWDLREVSERCQLLKLGGLGSELGDYLRWKFEKAGRTREVVTPDAVRVLAHDRDRDVPLVVNNIVAVAMNMAFEVGKDTINAELMSDAIKAAQSGSVSE